MLFNYRDERIALQADRIITIEDGRTAKDDYGLPISIGVIYLIYKSLMNSFQFEFTLPWVSIIYVIVAVFIMVSTTMLYASSKVKKENIIDALKQESS